MKKDKVLVAGAVYSLNFGDGVICRTMCGLIRREWGAEPVLFGLSGVYAYPDRNQRTSRPVRGRFVRRFPPVKALLKYRNRRQLIRKLNRKGGDCTALVFAGGQLFMDCFSEYILWIVRWAQEKGIPVMFHCCGVGPLSEAGRSRLTRALTSPSVAEVSVREREELFYREFPERIPVKRVLDPALEAPSFFPPAEKRNGKTGIGVIHPVNFRKDCVRLDREQYLELLTLVIRLCRQRGLDFELFTNGDPLDQAFCTEAAEILGCPGHTASCPENPEDLIRRINGYEQIFAARLHALILAAAYRIPAAAFVWDRKIREFMELTGRASQCLSLDSPPGPEETGQVLDRLLEDDGSLPPLATESSSLRLKVIRKRIMHTGKNSSWQAERREP